MSSTIQEYINNFKLRTRSTDTMRNCSKGKSSYNSKKGSKNNIPVVNEIFTYKKPIKSSRANINVHKGKNFQCKIPKPKLNNTTFKKNIEIELEVENSQKLKSLFTTGNSSEITSKITPSSSVKKIKPNYPRFQPRKSPLPMQRSFQSLNSISSQSKFKKSSSASMIKKTKPKTEKVEHISYPNFIHNSMAKMKKSLSAIDRSSRSVIRIRKKQFTPISTNNSQKEKKKEIANYPKKRNYRTPIKNSGMKTLIKEFKSFNIYREKFRNCNINTTSSSGKKENISNISQSQQINSQRNNHSNADTEIPPSKSVHLTQNISNILAYQSKTNRQALINEEISFKNDCFEAPPPEDKKVITVEDATRSHHISNSDIPQEFVKPLVPQKIIEKNISLIKQPRGKIQTENFVFERTNKQSHISSDYNNYSSNHELIENSKPVSEKEEKEKGRIYSFGVAENKLKKKIKSITDFTHIGFDGENDKPHNQDSYFIYKNFGSNPENILFSVCDGHGLEGHEVSHFIKKVLPADLSDSLKGIDLNDSLSVSRIIKRIFMIVNDKLINNDLINSSFSGSTCATVIYTPEKLICSNLGDSRAVLGSFVEGKWEFKNLTRDHKPSEQDEAIRINERGGVIRPFLDEGEFIGPLRVWIKNEEIPGLAMTRSFGDRVAALVGVISEPEITEHCFKEEDKFMLIASDGIWEFIKSDECVNMIKEFYLKDDPRGCIKYLYQESKARWKEEEDVIDDMTMILIFFE